jgi:hypothetical protein
LAKRARLHGLEIELEEGLYAPIAAGIAFEPGRKGPRTA